MAKASQTMTPAQGIQAFLARRRKLLGGWHYVAPGMLIIIVASGSYGFLRVPLLINPFELFAKLEAGSLPDSTIVTLAAMVPILFGGRFVHLIALLVLLHAAVAIEKRYMAIIEASSASAVNTPEGPA